MRNYTPERGATIVVKEGSKEVQSLYIGECFVENLDSTEVEFTRFCEYDPYHRVHYPLAQKTQICYTPDETYVVDWNERLSVSTKCALRDRVALVNKRGVARQHYLSARMLNGRGERRR